MRYLFLLLFSLSSFASNYPDYYRYQILVGDKTSSTVTAQSFMIIPHTIASLSKEDVPDLVVRTDWVKPYFTAWATKEDSVYAINFWGGLARIPGMNDEGHALVACHELGHILGGTPKIRIKEFLWSSAEGQSDYYATKTCLKKYFNHLHKTIGLKIPATLNEVSFTLCRTSFSEETDYLACLNTMKGVETFSKVLAHLSQYNENPAVEFQDKTKVKETLYDSYPGTQCRIDTLVRGALNLSRPSCWFYR